MRSKVSKVSRFVMPDHPGCARFGRLRRSFLTVRSHPSCTRRGLTLGLVFLTSVILSAGCRQQMSEQPRYEPLEASPFFADGRSARPLPMNVVARGHLHDESEAKTYTMPVTIEVMKRGQERYNIFCTPCHDQIGNGQGMAVRRGFRRGPPSLHIDRLREAQPDHFYDVITNGFGAMYDYAAQIEPADRWAIIAYIRALQLSQGATLQDLTEDERRRLEGAVR